MDSQGTKPTGDIRFFSGGVSQVKTRGADSNITDRKVWRRSDATNEEYWVNRSMVTRPLWNNHANGTSSGSSIMRRINSSPYRKMDGTESFYRQLAASDGVAHLLDDFLAEFRKYEDPI
jgi:hypothetical protein